MLRLYIKLTAKQRCRRKGVNVMALTRKFLKSMGIEDDKIDEIIDDIDEKHINDLSLLILDNNSITSLSSILSPNNSLL